MNTIKYPSIEQFKNVIQEVTRNVRYKGTDENNIPIYNNEPLPTITFNGTVKIHGSNAGIRYEKSGNLIAQSRERDLSLLSDNMGFCAFTLKNEEVFRNICSNIIGDNDAVVVYGEWFGKGINSNVAVNELSKRLAIFGIRFIKDDNEQWVVNKELDKYLVDNLEEYSIYNINQFGTWSVDVDFNHPELIQNTLIDITNAIEKECPVGKYFGISSTGEGAVYSAKYNGNFYQFKIKGEKHSNSKVKTLAPIDEEMFKNIKEFADNFTTEARLQQGIFVMKNEMLLEPTPQNTGNFIKWVVSDVIKEEQSNIVNNGLDVKKVAREVGNIARLWYNNQL